MSCNLRNARTELASLYQQGSLKALFPKSPTDQLDAVFLNTAGGITGGDIFTYELDVAKGAALRVTSQAAERVYKAQSDQVGRVAVTARIDAGGSLHWLPQETIVFDQANLSRKLDIDLCEASEFLCVEPIVFGRAAMGEAVRQARISDQWRVRRDGKLVFADALKIDGNIADILSNGAVADGDIAAAAILLVSPKAETKLEALRRAIGQTGGASLVRDGVLFSRIVAPDSFSLRQALIPAIETLTDMQIPKTWRL